MVVNYKGTSVFYTDSGKGPSIVLLHGFLENSSMWHNLIPELTTKNRVICIDLLGHGKTGSIGYIHTMEDMAIAVKIVLKHLKLRKYHFVGHSMGGYVALAFAKLFPENIKGLCLMNSTFEADNKERKLLRTRANKMVQTNFKNIVHMSFTNLFSSESKKTYKTEFETALKTALKTSIQGYLSAQEGMKIRKDLSVFFANATFKKLIILGKKDTVINVKSTLLFAKKHRIETKILSEGHMSHIENKQSLNTVVIRFIEKKPS